MAFLPAVQTELVVHPTFTLLGGDLARSVGVGAGREGWGSRSGLVLIFRRPGRRRRRWGRRRGRGRRRRAGRFVGTTGSIGVPLATLIVTHLLLAFPVTVVDLENAGFEGGEGADCSGVAKTKVLAEAAGEAPVEAGPEGFLVPGGLGG